jgi:hypothetical protein
MLLESKKYREQIVQKKKNKNLQGGPHILYETEIYDQPSQG